MNNINSFIYEYNQIIRNQIIVTFFRIYIFRNLNSTTVVIRPKNRTPYKQWIPAVFLTILLCCLSLAHAIVMTDGYYKSCEQYKKRLIYLLNSGREAEVEPNDIHYSGKSNSFLYLHLILSMITIPSSFYRLFVTNFLAERFLILWIIYKRI